VPTARPRRGQAGAASVDQQYPTIGLIWVDGGYANSVDASLIDWADHELGIKLAVVGGAVLRS
jgi:hypothetical protein